VIRQEHSPENSSVSTTHSRARLREITAAERRVSAQLWSDWRKARIAFLERWRDLKFESNLAACEDLLRYLRYFPSPARRGRPQPPLPKRRRGPRLKTILDKARKAGAASVTTPEGFTYAIGQAAEAASAVELNPFEREATRLRLLKRGEG
jgi:hypothetical protein